MTTYTNNHLKILLVNPPSEFKTPVLPLGLASIAAYLKSKDKDIDISVIDAWVGGIGFEELENRVSQSKADIVGIYMVSPRYERGKRTIEVCRKALPNSLIIAGGPHPSAMPAETLREIPELDVCGIGEGEMTMYELVQAIRSNSSLSGVNGLAFKDKNTGEIIITKPREFIKNLDDLPLPARELFPIKKYKPPSPLGRKKPYLTMVTSRGCPFQCAYCSKDVFKQNYRARSPQKVCDEIEELIAKYGAREILFCDDDFSLNMQRAGEICDEILRRGLKFRWSTSTRVDQVDENLLRKMKQAGCWLVCYGVESGNQKILDAINKGVNINQVISAFETTRRVGLSTVFYAIIGLPGETKETIQDTLNLMKKTKPSFISGGVLIVYPGSRLFKLIQQGTYKGRLRTLDKGENMPGVYFKGNYTTLEDNLTFEELKEAVKKMQRAFYFRPQYVIQSLKNIRSFGDLAYYLNGGAAILKSLIK